MKFFTFIFVLMIVCSTTFSATPKNYNSSNVAKFYKANDLTKVDRSSLEYLKKGEAVNVIHVYYDEREKYKTKFAEQSLISIGSSVFKDRSLPESAFIAQAKKVGASLVTYISYDISEVPYSSSDDPNNLDSIYDYFVEYWVKDTSYKKPDVLGVKTNSISIEKRNSYQRNTGAYIESVMDGSRAFRANLIPGDVIIAINETPVEQAQNANVIQMFELDKSKLLNFKIIRLVNNEPKEITIPVQFE